VSDIPISIDTRHAQVAREAVEAGADIVNDVSGGTFDPDMLRTISDLHVPVVLMHMRGTPETMQEMTEYDSVVVDVANTLLSQSSAAEEFGVPRWMQILDPGIGFAKDLNGNLKLLSHMSELRRLLQNVPILLGTSRKGFIGKLSGENNPENRDYGTIASCVASLCLENRQADCNIVRVHNVKAVKQGLTVMDAIVNAKFSG
jgi:dihydropteroate synthase